MAQPPNEIAELVQRFEHNLDAYRSEAYNEARLRQEFLNPFFRSLGWDMDNRQGYAEAYKDVIHEDSIKVGGATKAPDYCFRIGQTRKFFVEAKKPAVNVKHASEPAFQLRRYGWSSKLPLSILTDFEEFAVYDCRVRPNHQDSAAKARVLYLTYSEYLTKWDSIAAIFSRDGVLKGHFDRFLAVEGGKSGTAEVDDAFLSEIESWRGHLANNLAIRNPALGTKEVNFIVQKTIDRVIFLRICEDRGIEGAERLKGIIGTTGVYSALCDLFKQADERYNSGLFHFYSEQDRAEPPDKLSLSVHIDDKLLSDLLRGLYYPDSPYEFSVLPADILGQVYEQFLGKVIRVTPGHRAKVEDKPAVKKAGGVFYTPTYIVDYIVSQTISQVLCDKTPKEAAKIRIIDPACGSGSFLLQAYQHLLDWHRQWYEADGTTKHKKVLYQGPGGGWRLTASERRRILLNNIFGIDIDAQAVEVTKLSLLLKVLEGETEESITAQLRLFHERALPDLGNNIKCGNSLIRPDIERYIGGGLFGDDEVDSVNPFEWKTEFKTIMVSGGFDVVIGNPPWGAKFRPVNLGTRYTLNFPSTEAHNHGAVFNLGTQVLDFPHTARDLECCNFGPRVGLAYRPGESWVIRSGYGMVWFEQTGITTPFTLPQFPFVQTVGQQSQDNINPAFALVAKAYLKESNRTLGQFIPTKMPDRAEIPAAPNAATVLKDYTGGAAISQGEAFAPTPANIESRAIRKTLPGGLKLVMMPKKTRGGTVFAQVNLRFGDRASLSGKAMIASFTGQILIRGTKTKSRQQIQDEMDRLKARINVGGAAAGASANIETVEANLAGPSVWRPKYCASRYSRKANSNRCGNSGLPLLRAARANQPRSPHSSSAAI